MWTEIASLLFIVIFLVICYLLFAFVICCVYWRPLGARIFTAHPPTLSCPALRLPSPPSAIWLLTTKVLAQFVNNNYQAHKISNFITTFHRTPQRLFVKLHFSIFNLQFSIYWQFSNIVH